MLAKLMHVDRDDCSAKFWLEPVELAKSIRFPARELRALQRMVEERREDFLEAWHEHVKHRG